MNIYGIYICMMFAAAVFVCMVIGYYFRKKRQYKLQTLGTLIQALGETMQKAYDRINGGSKNESENKE